MSSGAYGYFIHPASLIGGELPVRVEAGEIGDDVVTFGSDGGGNLYCLARADSSVYYLPNGLVVDGVYRAGLGDPRKVAGSFAQFLRELLESVREVIATGRRSPARRPGS